MAVNTALFHMIINLSGSTFEPGMANLVGMLVGYLVYMGHMFLKLYGLWVPTLICFVIQHG